MGETPQTTSLKLLSSHDEAGNVRTFVFETGGLTWVAGQAQAYILPQAGSDEKARERWFTISSAPSEKTINISTRVSQSAFKQALNKLRPGDQIQAHSLEGDFTWEARQGARVVLIAGGIGITPFRSFLTERHIAGKTLGATLIYFNRTNDVPFRRELEALAAKHRDFTIHIVIGESITADRIAQLAPPPKDVTFYLSGPEPMVETVGGTLKERGFSIKQDWFPGYDDKTY